MNPGLHFSFGHRKHPATAPCLRFKLQWVVMLAAALVLWPTVSAHAAFSSDIAATGQIDYDTAFAAKNFNTATAGSFSVIEGGIVTGSTFTQDGVVGVNPLLGTLTDIGDGFGITANAAGDFNDTSGEASEFGVGVDVALTLANSSLTDTYQVTVGIAGLNPLLSFSNSVTSSGGDAYADSEFSVKKDLLEVFFTDLTSDTANGNAKNGSSLVDFGGLVSDSGMFSFDVLLAPGVSSSITGTLTMEGGAYESGSSYAGDFIASLRIIDVVNQNAPAVPVPGALLLAGTGLIALGRRRRN